MQSCASTYAPVIKGDRFGLFQSPVNQLGIDRMKGIPYASAVGSLMYAQVSTRPNLAFVTEMFGKFQSHPGLDH